DAKPGLAGDRKAPSSRTPSRVLVCTRSTSMYLASSRDRGPGHSITRAGCLVVAEKCTLDISCAKRPRKGCGDETQRPTDRADAAAPAANRRPRPLRAELVDPAPRRI